MTTSFRTADFPPVSIRGKPRNPEETGLEELIWNGLDDMGASAPTGLYLICVDVDRIRHTRRVMLVR